jgi:hypothetical protein
MLQQKPIPKQLQKLRADLSDNGSALAHSKSLRGIENAEATSPLQMQLGAGPLFYCCSATCQSKHMCILPLRDPKGDQHQGLLTFTQNIKCCPLRLHPLKHTQWFRISAFGEWKPVAHAKCDMFVSRYIVLSLCNHYSSYFSQSNKADCSIGERTSDCRTNSPTQHVLCS